MLWLRIRVGIGLGLTVILWCLGLRRNARSERQQKLSQGLRLGL